MANIDEPPGWAVWILLCMGCGSVNASSLDGNNVDGTSLDGNSLDAATGSDGQTEPLDAAAQCDPLARFSAPMLVDGLATTNTAAGSLSSDELAIYTWSNGVASATTDIYVASRATITEGFGMLSLLTNVSSDSFSESEPWISPDGLTLVFTTNRDGPDHLYAATRSSVLTDFGTFAALSGIQTLGANDSAASVTADGNELWFISDRSGGLGGYDIWRATKSGSAFANPAPVAEVSSVSLEAYPVLSADKLTIYVSSTRPGGMGGFDIWRAHRSTAADGFGAEELVTELNTTGDDFVKWLSPDGCRLFIRSNRTGGVDHVFVALRGSR